MRRKADFDYLIEGDIIIITDLDYGNISVTNDIENVLHAIDTDLHREGKRLSNFKIIYQDSQRIFDGILIDEKGKFVDFYAIQESSIIKAKSKIR